MRDKPAAVAFFFGWPSSKVTDNESYVHADDLLGIRGPVLRSRAQLQERAHRGERLVRTSANGSSHAKKRKESKVGSADSEKSNAG